METLSSTKTNHSQKIADELAHFLADTYVLYLKTQNFHWNVTGPQFPSLHLLFEKQYQELAEATDEIAERIRALGCFAPASFAAFSKLTSLKEAPNNLSAEDMLRKLYKDHETIAHYLQSMMAKVQKAQDEATFDLLVERLRSHEKMAWMLKSSLLK